MNGRIYVPKVGSESGSGTVLAIAVIGALLTLVCTLIPLLAGFSASQAAAGAADSAALAAADVSSGLIAGVPCEAALRVATMGGTRLESCTLEGATATVVVTRAVAGLVARATARAGPPGTPTN